MLEVVLAGSMLLGYLSYIEHTFQRPATASLETIADEKLAQDIMVSMDLRNESNTTYMRRCLAQGNYTCIEGYTRELLPRNYLFSYTIGSYKTREIPQGGKVTSAEYLIYDQNNTKPISYRIRLSVWSAI
jgi:hypothetical protein